MAPRGHSGTQVEPQNRQKGNPGEKKRSPKQHREPFSAISRAIPVRNHFPCGFWKGPTLQNCAPTTTGARFSKKCHFCGLLIFWPKTEPRIKDFWEKAHTEGAPKHQNGPQKCCFGRSEIGTDVWSEKTRKKKNWAPQGQIREKQADTGRPSRFLMGDARARPGHPNPWDLRPPPRLFHIAQNIKGVLIIIIYIQS